MTQQENITALGVPAGARSDAAFLAATTAPPTLVFAPGAVFPNNGPIQQNVYTSGNSSGVDGLQLLQDTIAQNALLPAIAMPSNVIEFDFSASGGGFTFTAPVAFGVNSTWRGYTSFADTIPVLGTTSTISPPVEIAGVYFIGGTAAGQTFTSAPQTLILSGGALVQTVNVPLYEVTSGEDCILIMKDSATTAGGAIVDVQTGGALTIYVEDFATLAGGTITSSGGNITINAAPSAFVDPSFYVQAHFIVNTFTGLPPIFQPGGGAGVNVFTAESAFVAAAIQAGNLYPPNEYMFDFTYSSGAYAQTAGWVFPAGAAWRGVLMTSNTSFTTTSVPQLTLTAAATSPVELIDIQVTMTEVFEAFGDPTAFFRMRGASSLMCATGPNDNWTDINITFDIEDSSVLGGNGLSIHSITNGLVVVNLYDAAILNDGAFAFPGGGIGHLTINVYSSAAQVGNSYATLAGCDINDLSGSGAIGPMGPALTGSGAAPAGVNSANAVDLSGSDFPLVLPTVGGFVGEKHSYLLGGANPNNGNSLIVTVVGGASIIVSAQYPTGPVAEYRNSNWGAFITFTWSMTFGTGEWIQN